MIRLAYFRPTEGYFWQWEDEGEVIAIPKGNTIAYKALIQEVLDALAPQGLPPFGALLLALIATNPAQDDSLKEVERIVEQLLGDSYPGIREDLTIFFHLMFSLPKAYKQGAKRIQVLQVIFERCHGILSLKYSNRITLGLEKKRIPVDLLLDKEEFRKETFVKDFRVLSLLLKRFPDPESVIRKIASLPGFEDELFLPEHDRGQEASENFITELTQNQKTFSIGSLIKRIWSGIHLPVQSSAPSQQALGGVSDITNKGNFDQLLISEYAHDDLVFLQRLANNEALYIQREVPPTSNIKQRIILIDVSLKNWGTPKTIAFATMLAIANHPKSKAECLAFTVGENWNPIAIDSIDGIIEGLQFLAGNLHFGKGLERFFTEYSLPADSEIILISEPSTLQYPDLQRTLSKYHKAINYWIHTDVEGHIDVYRKQQKSKRHLQHIVLPLDKLWARKSNQKQKQKSQKRNNRTYPILFKKPNAVKKVIPTPEGDVFLISIENTLLRFSQESEKENNKGLELIFSNLPITHMEVEIGASLDGAYTLLMFDKKLKEIHLWNLSTNAKKQVPFPEWEASEPGNILFIKDVFFYTNRKGCWEISLEGEISNTEIFDKEGFFKRLDQHEKANATYYSPSSILKNVRMIFINDADKLVFNAHQLRLTKDSHLMIKTSNLLERKIMAEKISDTEFLFSDGSKIEINRTGMFMLESSDPQIPNIYLPSALDASLGVATDTHFAGSDYFYLDPRDMFSLQKPGPEKEQRLDLEDRFGIYSLEKISTTDFYEKYIQAFIDQILSYGTEA